MRVVVRQLCARSFGARAHTHYENAFTACASASIGILFTRSFLSPRRAPICAASGREPRDTLVRFWRHLREATFTDDNRLFSLSEDTTFLGSSSLPSKLYVREEYESFWEYILAHYVRRGHSTKLLVTGNPGIGKSVFGLLVLYRLATMASTLDAQYAPHIIVFQRTASKARYLFRTDGHVREGTLDDFVPELNCPSTWCVRQNTPTHYLTF